MVEKIGSVAYRLRLPPKSRIHDVFHVVFLKKHTGDLPAAPVALPPIAHGRALPVLAKVLRATPAHNSWNLLVQWEGRSPAEATWEPLTDFKERYPTFKLEDELFGQVLWTHSLGRSINTRRSKRRPQRISKSLFSFVLVWLFCQGCFS